jgi:hypothetical protein
MTRVRRGGYIFITWKGDHPPAHVHVYQDGRLILKWNLDEQRSLGGQAPRRLSELIRELCSEGRL